MSTATATAPKTATANKPRVAPVMTGTFEFKVPENIKTARGSKSPYPFDTLEVGKAFGLKNKTAKQMSSIVSNQNRKKENQQPVKDENGNTVFKMTEMKAADGSVTKVPTNEPETEAVKEFRALDVTKEIAASIKGTPLEGSTVLIARVK